jgi:DNA uptake protein ComE-like DNA-binding protein
MTRIVHTAKYIKERYRKYQMIAFACAVFTVAAALLAAFSGLQVNKLQKAQAQKSADTSSNSEKVLKVWMEKEIESLKAILTKTQNDLAKEKEAAAAQQKTIDDLKRQLAAITAKARALEAEVAKPSPSKSDTSSKSIGTQPASTPPASLTQEPRLAPATGTSNDIEPKTIREPERQPTAQPPVSPPSQPAPENETQSAPAQKPGAEVTTPQPQASPLPITTQPPTSGGAATPPLQPEPGAQSQEATVPAAVPADESEADRSKAITEEPLTPSQQQ